MVVGSVNGAASFAFNGLICTTEVHVRRGLLAQNLTCFSQSRGSQADARQGGGWFMRVHLKVLIPRCLDPESQAGSSSSMLDIHPPSKP